MNRRLFLASLSGVAVSALSMRVSLAAELRREVYHAVTGECVGIGKFHEFGPSDFVFDYANNRVGQVQSGVGTEFSMLSTLVGPGEVVTRGEVRDDTLRIGALALHRSPVRRETFQARNGAVTISAEVAVRTDMAERGTLVMVHGSGPGPLSGLDFWAHQFLSQGWRVVAYDKRGSGKSSGDWLQADLKTLADDARAVVRSIPNVRRPLGFWGISQAGWVLPQLSDTADFLIMHAGAATTVGQQMLDAIEAEMLAYGMSAAEIAKAMAYNRLDIAVSQGRADWNDLQLAYQRALAEKAEWLRGPPEPATSPFRSFIRLIADFNAEQYWRTCNIPVLAIFGSKDVIVPVSRNLPLLRQFLGRNKRFHEVVLPGANHIGMLAETGVRREYPRRTNIDPIYFRTIAEWLKAFG